MMNTQNKRNNKEINEKEQRMLFYYYDSDSDTVWVCEM